MTRIVLSALVVLVLAAAAGAGATRLFDDEPSVAPTSLQTSYPEFGGADEEPDLPALKALSPEPGTIGRVDGPFDDRFTLTDLELDGDTVTGTLNVTSDVSELLELQVLVAFYDAQGRWVATERFVEHAEHLHGEGAPEQSHPFAVSTKTDTPIASAAIGVPVLVNE